MNAHWLAALSLHIGSLDVYYHHSNLPFLKKYSFFHNILFIIFTKTLVTVLVLALDGILSLDFCQLCGSLDVIISTLESDSHPIKLTFVDRRKDIDIRSSVER